MFLKFEFIVSLILVLSIKCDAQYDPKEYCANELKICGSFRRHIYCHPEQLTSTLTLNQIVPMTVTLKNLILRTHNKYRNEFACGDKIVDKNGDYYEPAARLREMVWDDELMFLAESHAKRCSVKHDECRGSLRFKFVGQNIYAEEYMSKFDRTPTMIILDSLKMWFNEHKQNEKNQLVKPFEPHGNFFISGHFITMMLEDADRIGCAISQCHGKKKYNFITCDYSTTNIIGAITYKSGLPRSQCNYYGVGLSNDYKCLCAKNNDITSNSSFILDRFSEPIAEQFTKN